MKFLFCLVWVAASGWFFLLSFIYFQTILFPYFPWRQNMAEEAVLCRCLLRRYYAWKFYNPLNYDLTCKMAQTSSHLQNGSTEAHGYHMHGVAQAWAWKRVPESWLLLCPQSGKFLSSWCQQLPGGSRVGGGCLVWGVVCFYTEWAFSWFWSFLQWDVFLAKW